MAEYSAIAMNDGKLVFPAGRARTKYIARHAGRWMRETLKPVGGGNPKTRQQLGYYWGLLLPEIAAELRRQGQTVSIRLGGVPIEVEPTDEDIHEAVTVLCGRVGPRAERRRLSECDLRECMKFIDNVLDLAAQLGMDVEKLKAWRPKNGELQPSDSGGPPDARPGKPTTAHGNDGG